MMHTGKTPRLSDYDIKELVNKYPLGQNREKSDVVDYNPDFGKKLPAPNLVLGLVNSVKFMKMVNTIHKKKSIDLNIYLGKRDFIDEILSSKDDPEKLF